MTGPADAYDGALSSIRKQVDDLGTALATWGTRDDTRACPEARRAANDAMDAIDGALAGLHAVRQRLVSEIRASDDATAARVDALLAGSARDPDDFPGPAGSGGNRRPGAGTPGPAERRKLMLPHPLLIPRAGAGTGAATR